MKSYRFWRFAVTVLAAYAAGLCASGASGAAFTNGDFESPYVTTKTLVVPTGWTTWASAGGFGHQLEPGGTQLPGSHQWYQGYTTTTTSCVGGLYQTFDTTPGASYRIKGYAACVHADMNASIGYNQGGWGGTITWLLTVDSPPTTEWYQINSGTGTVVTATGSSMTIVLRGSNDAPTSKTSRLVKFDNIQVIPECTPPNPPTAGTATANSTSQITWGWTRASGASGEVYCAYDASSGGTLKWTSASQATSYAESGLSRNTLYGSGAGSGNQRHLATYKDCESTTRLALPAKYTLQDNATTPTFGTITTSSIVLNTTGPVNLTAGSSGVIFKRGTTDLAKVQALTTTDSGLTANTQYTYTARGVNGDNVASTESGSASKYTLAKAPAYGTSGDVTIQCAQGQTKTDCTAGQNITFTFNNSFGSGPANVGQFGYLWDQNAGDPASWTGEQFWTSGSTLVKQAGTAGQSYYLHIRSYNNDSPKAVNTTVLNLGPYAVPAPTPTAPSVAAATNIGANTITWNWNDLSDNEDGFKVYDAASGGNLLQTLGENVESWAESNLENNTTYYRWVSAYNEYGESSRTALAGVSTTIPDCIQNEGFEGTFYSGRAANWKAFNSPTLASSTDCNSGTYSQRSTVNSGTPRKGVYQIFNVTQGRYYNASGYFKNDATSTSCRISLDPDPGTLDETNGKETYTTTWGWRDIQSAIPDGVQATGTTMAVIVSAFKNSGSTTGYGYFDDIRLSPGITQPSNAAACAGSTATFSITATGTGNTYKWQKNTGSGWADISSGDGSGQDSATYTTPTLTDAMNGYQYRCVVTGPAGPCGGTIASKAATLTVTPVTAVTTHPQNAVVCVGSTATFSVVAVGGGLSYQWQKNTGSGWSNIPSGEGSGQNAATYTTPAATEAMDGCQYRCVVTGTCGSPATSNAATLTVSTGPSAPNAQSASDIGTDSIKWNWEAVSGATGYKLWTESTGGTQIGGTITTNYYTESLLDPDTSYTRYVEAFDNCGTSSRTQLGPVSTDPRQCSENGDFEGGFYSVPKGSIGVHWRVGSGDGTESFAQATNIKRSGTSSQKITDPSGGQVYTPPIYQKLNVQPGRGYALRYYSYRTGAFVTSIGCDVNGGTTFSWWDTSAPSNEWVFREVTFTSGTGGVITIGFRGGQNGGDTVGYVDDVDLRPAKPTSTGGTTTICTGGSATLTASGGFGGSDSELHWYTAANGGGTHVGTGTSLEVSPTTTTTYYPRWEDSANPDTCRYSDDGAPVTVTVAVLPSAPAASAAGGIGADRITWNWQTVSGAAGYRLWTLPEGGTQIDGDIAANSYTEAGLSPGTPYTRYVEAYNACGPSATRTELSASTNTRYCPDNPGYETFIGGVAEYWATAVEAGTTSSWSVSTDSHSGNAQKISWTNTGEIAYVYQRINCTPGASYQVSCWFKIGATPCRAIIRVDPNGGTDPKGSGVTYKEWNDCTAWKSETAPPFVAGPGGVVTIFTGGADRTAESAYRWVLFDDVSVLPADPDAALVNGAGSLAYCADAAPSTIELSLTGGYGIASAVRWYDDADLTHQVAAGSPATIAAPTTTTTYYGVYVDDCGKSGARSVTVTVNQLPPAPTSPNNPSRCGSGEVSFQVTVPEGCSVRWYGSASGGSVLSTDNPYTTTISSTTTFYAASVSSSGCESASRTACTATVNTPPTAAASNNGPVCEGSTLSLTGGPNGMSSYSWAGPNGFTSDEQSPTVSASATVAMGGTYTLTVTDSNGCTATATTNAVVIASPSAAVSGGGTVCAGGSATVQAVLTGTAPWSITWSDSVTQSNVTESPAVRTVSPGSTTTYTVTAVSDANCTGAGSGSAVVTIVDPPSTTLAVTAVPGTVCSGDSSTIRVAGSEAGVSYALFVKGGSQVGADQEGTGGDLDFATGSLTETTTFTVRATRSPCAAVDLSTEPTVVVDDVAPTVLYVTSDTANGTYGANADIDVSVKFSEPVTVGDTETKPRVRLETGTVDRCAEFSGVDTEDTSILHFTYTVQTGDQSADLDYTAVDALELNGGSITDECGNNAVLTLPSPGSEGSLGANKNIVIVTAQPGQISGAVSMETYSDSTYSFSRTVRFAATDSGGELLKTWDVEITFTNVSPAPPGLGYAVGSYTLNDVPEGTAALSAKTNWSLRRRVSVTLDEYGRASDVNFSILGGDLDASNSINILDYVRLKTKWHSSDAAADINADGTVQGLDYSIMKANWFRVGDSQ